MIETEFVEIMEGKHEDVDPKKVEQVVSAFRTEAMLTSKNKAKKLEFIANSINGGCKPCAAMVERLQREVAIVESMCLAVPKKKAKKEEAA